MGWGRFSGLGGRVVMGKTVRRFIVNRGSGSLKMGGILCLEATQNQPWARMESPARPYSGSTCQIGLAKGKWQKLRRFRRAAELQIPFGIAVKSAATKLSTIPNAAWELKKCSWFLTNAETEQLSAASNSFPTLDLTSGTKSKMRPDSSSTLRSSLASF